MAKSNAFLSQFNVVIDFAVEIKVKRLSSLDIGCAPPTNVDNRKPAVTEADLKSLIRRFVKTVQPESRLAPDVTSNR